MVRTASCCTLLNQGLVVANMGLCTPYHKRVPLQKPVCMYFDGPWQVEWEARIHGPLAVRQL